MVGGDCYALELQRLDASLKRTRTTVLLLSIVCGLLLLSTMYMWSLRQKALDDQRATAAAAVSLIGELEEVREIAERVAVALNIDEATMPDLEAASKQFVDELYEKSEVD